MRKIEQKMIDFIDQKLAGNGAAQEAILKRDARAIFIYACEACVGIREVGGNNKGPMVELIQETIGRAEREAWCMAFIQTCLAYAENKSGQISPIAASEHCMTVWRSTPPKQRVKTFPLPGAIIIWKKGSTDSGHTGAVSEWRGQSFEAIEGNTEQGILGGKVERDGGGVYMTERKATGTGMMKVVGFLKPF